VLRSYLSNLAASAAADPSRASDIARHIARILADAEANGGDLPEGYIYSGAHTWEIQADNVDVEPVGNFDSPVGLPLTDTSNQPIPLKVPFDGLIMGIAGWAQPQAVHSPDIDHVTLKQVRASFCLSRVVDFRDLFSVEIGLDGTTTFGTDGNDRMLYPASTVVGSRLSPRPTAWTVRRNQRLQARFRNISNVSFADGSLGPDIFVPPLLSKIVLAFYVLNLEAP